MERLWVRKRKAGGYEICEGAQNSAPVYLLKDKHVPVLVRYDLCDALTGEKIAEIGYRQALMVPGFWIREENGSSKIQGSCSLKHICSLKGTDWEIARGGIGYEVLSPQGKRGEIGLLQLGGDYVYEINAIRPQDAIAVIELSFGLFLARQ